MRICIVNEFFYPDSTGGTGTVLSDLVRSLRDRHSDVTIDVITSNNLYREKTADLPAYEDWDGVGIHRLATPRPNGLPTPLRLGANLLFCLGALGKLMRMDRYDALLVATAPPMAALSAHLLKRLKGTPFVYIVYDLEPDRSVTMKVMTDRHPAVRLFRQGQRQWLHSASRVIVLGRCMREFLGQAYRLPAEKVEVIPIGSDPDEILPASTDTRFRAEQGLQDKFVVLYSGNFGRYHNFDSVLDAAKQIQAVRPEVAFVLVGRGAQKEHIAQRIAEEGIASVRLLDFVPKEDYTDLLASADASLVTLEPGMEGLCVPSKFYSILASGRPTLAAVSPRSEVALVIGEAQCGIQVDQGTPQELVDAVLHLADHPDECRRMGWNARKALEEDYSTQRLSDHYYQVLQDCVRSSRVVQRAAGTRSEDKCLSAAAPRPGLEVSSDQ